MTDKELRKLLTNTVAEMDAGALHRARGAAAMHCTGHVVLQCWHVAFGMALPPQQVTWVLSGAPGASRTEWDEMVSCVQVCHSPLPLHCTPP